MLRVWDGEGTGAKMTMRVWVVLIAGLTSACATFGGGSKCSRIWLKVEGVVENFNPAEHQVTISVTPDPNEPQDGVVVTRARFEATVHFDPTLSGGRWHHDCGRRPTELTIRLLRKGTILKEETLIFVKEFEALADGYTYRAKRVLRMAAGS